MGLVLYELERYEEAQQCFYQAIELEPSNQLYYDGLMKAIRGEMMFLLKPLTVSL